MRERHVAARANTIHHEQQPRNIHVLKLLTLLVLFIPVHRATQVLRFRMDEEKPVGFLIGLLLKQLPDAILTSTGTLMFRSIDQEDARFFIVGVNDGRVQVAKRIDREAICPYTEVDFRGLDMQPDCQLAFSVNLLRITNTTTEIVDVLQIFITVDDVDDHSCTFQPSEKQTIYLPEDTLLNTSIPLHRPVDMDTGRGHGINSSSIRVISESVATDTHAPRTFVLRVSNTDSLVKPYALELVLQSSLDYESINLYNMEIIATGYDNFDCRLLISVHVTDCNDNPPRFASNFSVVHISETSKPNVPIYSVSAVDSDLGPLYSKLIYEIDSFAPEIIKRTFRIDPETGSIFLQRPLNHRKQTTYDIPVTVRNPVRFEHNSGIPDALTQNIDYRFMDRMQVRVHVASTTDQAPTISVFTPEGGEIITLPEHVSDLPFDFAVVSVATEKVALNSYINCTLEHSGIKQFRLTQISTSKQSSHQLIAVGAENLSISTPVELIYKLSALQSFDREILNTVPLKIQCHDAGNPPLTSEYVIQVHIEDKNDHSPQFNKTKWRFAVNEDSDPGRQRISYMIAQINAVDLDAGQNAQITYHITEETYGSHFFVDKITGTVRSKGNLDREKFDHHQFTLLAIDNGTPPLTGSTVVTVFVRDYNDEAPVFAQQMYTFHIEENNGYGELIGSLHATDMDEGSNAAIDFSLELMLSPSKLRTVYAQSTIPPLTPGKLPFDLVSYFDTLHNTYEVRLYASRMIDREAVAPSSLFLPEKLPPMGGFAPSVTAQLSTGPTKPSPTFKFWVVGEDGGVPRRRGQTMIHVLVDDVNDQHPVFQVPRNNSSLVSLSYMEKTGHGVFQVSATDADAGPNGTVRYFVQSIYLHNQTLRPQKRDNSTSDSEVLLDSLADTDHVGRYSSLFNIHETTGVIFLVNELTEADMGKLFSVELVAQDMGTPISLRSTIVLLIRIDDSAPIGNINNQLYNLLGNRPEQSSPRNGKSYLNFYIILSILFISGFISVVLMSVMCFVLRKRRIRSAHSIPALESNGNIEIPMRNAQLWVTHKQGIDSSVKTLKRMSRSNSWVMKELSSETANDEGTVSLLSSLPTERVLPYNPTALHLLNVQPCTSNQAMEQLQQVQMVCSGSDSVPHLVTAPLVLARSISPPIEPIILYTADEQANPAGKVKPPQTNNTGVKYLYGTLPTSTRGHPTEVQHMCLHPKHSKRNSVGSLDRDSGNEDSLDTSTASGQPVSKAIWLPTGLSTFPQVHASFALPFVHIYSPLSCVTEVDPNVALSSADN
ncbi:hypothetical protein CRM22_004663 [Opisthorchis felineus]|uniref:Cadherin domain-containing protein n=1 Tax=Opisthorchis felineus TaxID=147828 RepID=A0A4V3SFA4_OPIFE|nr:hypothetical protein CRM22_004663 [Opisthorchis felineus]